MRLGRYTNRLAQLWQLPLLVVSLFLFAYATYRFIDPKPGLVTLRRIETARLMLKQERADAAIEKLNELLAGDKLKPEIEGAVHAMLGEALELAQRQKHIDIPANRQRIIVQTKLAISMGIEPDAQIHRRLAESYEAIGRANDAVVHYRQAAELDKDSALKWLRRVIDLQLAREDYDAAAGSLDDYLGHTDLAGSERAWAMGEKARMLADRGEFAEAGKLLTEAMKLAPMESDQGQFNYWLGYCQWKLGTVDQAERLLRVSRDLLHTQHPLDADAAYALGKIRQDQKDYAGAISFFAAVLQSHLDSRAAPLAKLGRGVCRIALGEDEAGLSDMQDLVRQINEKTSLPPRLRDEMVAALREALQLLSARANYTGSLEVLAYEQELVPKPPAEFFGRLGRVYEKRAEQLEALAPDGQDKNYHQQRVREIRTKAGDAFIALARGLTLKDDKGYGQAMWKAIELFDRAGELHRVISALETFSNERPDDPSTPDALLKLGQSYQAMGLFDKAILAYRKNQAHYPKSLAASKSGVPLARTYIAKGPEAYKRAEEALLSVVENNPQVTPEAEEFREALWELVNLYSRTARYETAIARLEEMTQRYPRDERMGQMLFLMSDSYRKSAAALDDRIAVSKASAATRPAVDLSEATAARTQRLTRAADLYGQVIGYYRRNAAVRDLDRLYLKLSNFYRADCVFDLGDYPEAIKLYGDAAFRYQDDALALTAYVQIVNANVALGRTEEAKAANERAKWMLRRMPSETFQESAFGMSKPYWEQWLKWSGESGLWK